MIRNLLEYLEKTASRHPNKVAFDDGARNVTFVELRDGAMSVGSALLERFPGLRNRPFLVPVTQSCRDIILFLGVLYAGHCYAPIDARLPAARRAQIEAELLPCAVLDDVPNVPVNRPALDAVRARSLDIDPAYILFTSGSTGVPKGIAVPHRAVVDLAEWLTDTFGLSEGNTLGNQTPFFFDASVKDICIAIKTGATVHILPRTLFSFPIRLLEYLNDREIDTVLWAASVLNLVARSGALALRPPRTLRHIFFAGEQMYGKTLNAWRSVLPEGRFINLYGPTEVTVDCAYYIVDRNFADGEPVPIGRACRNKEILLLDENGMPVADGALGEIFVRGSGVALGYYNRPEETAAAFTRNPLCGQYPDIIYRTGDLARINERGELVFAARCDAQIKHLGYRIELGDIESAAVAASGVDIAVCLYDGNALFLLYQGAAEESAVRDGLRKSLPKYMLPAAVRRVVEMPCTPNGKIDRRALGVLYAGGRTD